MKMDMANEKSIVLIDDNEVDNFINKRLIELLELATEVKIFKNGRDGIEFLKMLSEHDKGHHLIFLDLNMPVMTGEQFLIQYQLLPQAFKDNTKVIILTSSWNPIDFQVVEALGFDDYITKPLTEEKIKKKIKKIFKEQIAHLSGYSS